MTQNSDTRRSLSGGCHEGEAAPSVRPLAVARPVFVATSGRREVAVRCPNCRAWHRHTGCGPKTAPCGAHYTVQPARRRLREAA